MGNPINQAQVDSSAGLCRPAETAGHSQPFDVTDLSAEEISYLLHELQVRQLELEMQNEELCRTKRQLELSRSKYEVEQERLLAAERKQRLLAETLCDVFGALTAQTSHKAVLDEVLRQLQRVVSYGAANIMLLEDGILRIARWQGYESFGSKELLSTLEQPLAAFPLDARVVQTQQSLVVPDTHRDPDWVVMEESSWIRSFVAVPICLHKRVLGLLRLDSDIPNKFSPDDVERLQPLANAAAIALRNARQYDQTRHEVARRAVQAETEIIQLNRKLLILQYAGATLSSGRDLQYVLNTVVKEMANLLDVKGCAIFEWDRGGNTVSVMAKYGLNSGAEEGSSVEFYPAAEFRLVERVLVERRPQQMTISHPGVYTAELAYMQEAKLKTLLMVPMEFQDRVVGLVTVTDVQSERTFTNREIGLVQLLGNQVASAIVNTRLYEQVQQQLAERMEIEKDLRKVAARQQAILNAIPDSFFYFSRSGRLLGYKTVDNHLPLGILDQTILKENSSGVQPTNLIDLIRLYIDQTLDSRKMQTFEYRLLLPEGPQDFEARLVASGPNEVLVIVRTIKGRTYTENSSVGKVK